MSPHRCRGGGKGKKRPLQSREIGWQDGRGEKHTTNAISHAVEKRYSRASDFSGKSPPGIFAAGHLRARRSLPLRSGKLETGCRCVCVCMCMYKYRACSLYMYVCVRETGGGGREGGGGRYFSIGISEGSEREIPGIDWSPGRSSGRISEREHHGRKCEPYSISAVRLSRHFYRARGAETCYWQACTFVIEID